VKISRNSFKKTVVSAIVAGTMLFSAAVPAAVAKGPAAPDKPVARNVIIMISDGCG
jgi:alkaline phosphatase